MAIYNTGLTVPRSGAFGGGAWELNKLKDITVIFARNGVGKSTLLRNARNLDPDQSHYVSPERGGEISFNAGYVVEEMSGGTRSNRRQANSAPTYREEVIARIQAYTSTRGSVRSTNIPVDPSEIEDHINNLMPEFRFSIKSGVTPFELRRTRIVGDAIVDEGIASVGSLSSGEAAIFALGLDVLTVSAMWKLGGAMSRTVYIDEPDLHLHPDLQVQLAKFLVEVMIQFDLQLVIASHSTTFLAALGHYGADKTSVIYLDNSANVQTAELFSTALQELSACLGGHALMGPLFARPLFLVEGDDDYRVWAQAVRGGSPRLAVIPCDGANIKKYIRDLEKVFQALQPRNPPAAYALKDNDSMTTTRGNSARTYVKVLKLNCHELENLYLADELLQKIGLTWTQACEKLRAKANEYGPKESLILAVTTADRRSADIKPIINELNWILDAGVDWRTRLGQLIGVGEPTGQMAEFLGQEVMRAFW